MSICVLCSDLIFATKIRSTAESLAADVRLYSGTQRLLAGMLERPCALLIVDLSAAGDPFDLIEQVNRQPPEPGQRPTILAFASHVDQSAFERAEQAGANAVWPRSRFSSQLPGLLSGRVAVSG